MLAKHSTVTPGRSFQPPSSCRNISSSRMQHLRKQVGVPGHLISRERCSTESGSSCAAPRCYILAVLAGPPSGYRRTRKGAATASGCMDGKSPRQQHRNIERTRCGNHGPCLAVVQPLLARVPLPWSLWFVHCHLNALTFAVRTPLCRL
jgi:hypothetical protein